MQITAETMRVSRKLRPRDFRPQTSDLENSDLETSDFENSDLETSDRLENNWSCKLSSTWVYISLR